MERNLMSTVMTSVTTSLSNSSFSSSVTSTTSSSKVCLSCGFPSSNYYGPNYNNLTKTHSSESEDRSHDLMTSSRSIFHGVISGLLDDNNLVFRQPSEKPSETKNNQSSNSSLKFRKMRGSSSTLEPISENRPAFSSRFSLTWLDFKRKQEEFRICRAAFMNDTEKVTTLLRQGVTPNCYDQQFRTPLHMAASKGYYNMVRLLLDNGADPNLLDSIGNTPLHLAACTNNVEVVVALLKAGTNVNAFDLRGRSPLQLAQSKLKILQLSTDKEVKTKVTQIIDMLLYFLKKKQSKDAEMESELLEGFQTRLQISETAEQLNTEIDSLSKVLDQMKSLDISGAIGNNKASSEPLDKNIKAV